ncbi:MAG: 1-acyl-sn-glycerol-3-phosphate acyltransferase [Planctomycetota bacterium]
MASTDAPARAATSWPDREIWPADPTHTSLAYRGIVRWGGTLVKTYYDVELRGEAFPEDRPVLLVQNHTNGLCDALPLLSASRRPIRILVKYKLMTTPLIGWMLRRLEAVPLYRRKDGVDTRKNAEAFRAIDEALAARSVIALFPEGESLDAIGLRELKSGVARMAISAEEAAGGDLGLVVVPIGVTHEDRDRFRTRISSVVGPPIEVGEVLRGAGDADARERVTALMGSIEAGLRALILHADDPEQFHAAVALERVSARDGAPLGLRRKAARAALVADAERDPDGAPARREAIRQLGDALDAGRLSGDDVLGDAPAAASLALRFAALVPGTLLGVVTHGLPSLAAVQISKLRRTPDKLVTLRVVPGSVLYALWGALLVGLGAWRVGALGAALALLAVAALVPLWPRVVDGLLAVRRGVLLRALARRGDELETLRSNVRAIREALPLQVESERGETLGAESPRADSEREAERGG